MVRAIRARKIRKLARKATGGKGVDVYRRMKKLFMFMGKKAFERRINDLISERGKK